MNPQENKLVAVVIPVYKSVMTELEAISYKQCMKVFSDKYQVIIVHPEHLKLPQEIVNNNHHSESFSSEYFKDIAGYNSLMISKMFYKRFVQFEYILIYQLDAFVFQDTLTEWCRKGYDYIGAPSLEGDKYQQLSENETHILKQGMEEGKPVLNGGLSLRKVSSILRYLAIYNCFYPKWKGNEDKLFCQDATRLKPMQLFIKIPDWKVAMDFAFEKSPAACYALKNQQLPFGCHAWERYDRSFWKPYIEDV